MSRTADGERPLAAVRGALARARAEADALAQRWAEETERRLKRSEDAQWHQARQARELEGVLARVAAVLGVELSDPPAWDRVVAAAADAAERLRALDVEKASARKRTQDADAVARRFEGHAAALARVAARLGLSTTEPGELLRAIERLHPR